MSLSAAFNIINSAFALDRGAVGGHLEQYLERQHARLCARNRQRPHQFLRRLGRRLGHARGQRRAAGTGQHIDLAGGERASAGQRADDAGADGERQRLQHLHVRRDAERQFAVGDAGEPAGRADDLRGLAEQRRGRPGRRHRRLQPRFVAEQPAPRRFSRCASRPTRTWLRPSPTINSLLSQFSQVNSTIVSGLATGANVSSAEDTRDSILTQLSQQIGISTVANPNGSTSIYTDSGVTLFRRHDANSCPSPRRRPTPRARPATP